MAGTSGFYTDLNEAQWAIVAPLLPAAFAWFGRSRRFSKDYEYRVQTSETMIDVAAIRLMLNASRPHDASLTDSEGRGADV